MNNSGDKEGNSALLLRNPNHDEVTEHDDDDGKESGGRKGIGRAKAAVLGTVLTAMTVGLFCTVEVAQSAMTLEGNKEMREDAVETRTHQIADDSSINGTLWNHCKLKHNNLAHQHCVEDQLRGLIVCFCHFPGPSTNSTCMTGFKTEFQNQFKIQSQLQTSFASGLKCKTSLKNQRIDSHDK